MRSWGQLAATVPVAKARPHSGSYSFRFCGGSLAADAWVNARASTASRGGSSRGAAATKPSQSPTLHWSPRYLLHSAKIGPIAWWIDGPHVVWSSDEKSGGSSQSAARTWPGRAYADSQADSTPPEESPDT